MGFKLNGFYTRSVPKLKYNEENGCYEIDEEATAGDKEGGWMFVFIDLILVALITKLASALQQCEISPHTLTFQCVTFVLMFMTRLQFDDYCNRFYTNDAFHRFFYFANVMAFFIMSLNVNIENTNHLRLDSMCKANLYGIGFGVGFLVSRFSLVVLYMSVMLEDSRAFEQFFSCVARTCLGMFFVLVFMWYEQAQLSQGEKGAFTPEYRMYAYLIACMVEWGGMSLHYIGLAFKKQGWNIHPVLLGMEYFPINVEKYQERFGAFIMTVLGQAIISVLTPYFDVQDIGETYQFNIISCLIIWCYGCMYYDASTGRSSEAQAGTEEHAMTHSLLSSYLYTWLHLFLGISMFYTSASIDMLYSDVVNTSITVIEYDTPEADDGSLKDQWNHHRLCTAQQLLAASIAFATIFMALMRLLHKGIPRLLTITFSDKSIMADQFGFVWRCGCAFFHLTVPTYKLPRPSMNQGLHMLFLVLMLLVEIEFTGKKGGKDGKADKDSKAGSSDGSSSGEGGRADRLAPRQGSATSQMEMMHHKQQANSSSSSAAASADEELGVVDLEQSNRGGGGGGGKGHVHFKEEDDSEVYPDYGDVYRNSVSDSNALAGSRYSSSATSAAALGGAVGRSSSSSSSSSSKSKSKRQSGSSSSSRRSSGSSKALASQGEY